MGPLKRNEEMRITGQCHCGSIAYEAELDPKSVGICHCSDCQTISATAFRTIAIVSGGTFRLKKGHPKKYVKVGDSGNRRIQAFCSNCGAGIYASEDGEHLSLFNLRVGTIDQRSNLIPKFECWRQSALGWLPEIDSTQKFEKNPK